MKLLFDPVMTASARQLDVLAKREKLSVANIANIETPGFRVKDLTFEQELLAESGRQDLPGYLRITAPTGAEVVEVEGLPSKNDGNNVNLDREMVTLSRTNLEYSTLVQMLVTKFKIMRSAATEGRK